jgi:aspartyl protease family protein
MLLVGLITVATSTAQALSIQAQALLKGTAVLSIDGKQRMLKVGKRSPEGVLLVSANPKMALIEIDGRQQQLSLTRHISGNYQPVEKREVAIPIDRANQYLTHGILNGRRISVLVDTGANTVALSSKHANALGISYHHGTPARVTTASGETMSYIIKLHSVTVGEITASGVDAAVIEGDYPRTVLLGMSYLKHVNLRENNGTLFLRAKY